MSASEWRESPNLAGSGETVSPSGYACCSLALSQHIARVFKPENRVE